MSDISKRVHSIDPMDETRPQRLSSATAKATDDIPGFVKRPEPMIPLLQGEEKSNSWLLWIGALFAILWIIATGAFFYFSPLGDLQTLSPESLFFLTAAILFPALAILLFFIAANKLNRVTAQAESFAGIGQALVTADGTAATQATTLAQSIRAEMNSLNDDLANLTERLRFLQENASDHAETINTSSSSFLATSDVIGQNLKIQRQSLESMSQTTEAKLDSLSALVSSHEKALKETTEATTLGLETAGTVLEERLQKYQGFAGDVEAQLLKTAEALENSKSETSQVLQSLEGQSATLKEKIEALKAENETLQTLMKERLEALETLNTANNEANTALAETIQHSINAAEKMREEAKKSDEALSKKREDVEQTLAKADAVINQTVNEQNGLILSKLDETEALLSKLDGRITRLQNNADAIEAVQLANADTRDMELEIPRQPNRKASAGRLHLKPLDLETESSAVEPLGIVPLDNPAQDQSLELDDVIKPLSRPEPLFGSSKKKEKSPWRWKDMMGGFENEAEPLALTTEELAIDETIAAQKVQSFEAWLNDFDLKPDTIISDGTILDYANAMIQTPENTVAILKQRMPDISKHFQQLASENPGFSEAAEITQDVFGRTINAEIMNRDAIRNRLSTLDGKTYLLAVLAS